MRFVIWPCTVWRCVPVKSPHGSKGLGCPINQCWGFRRTFQKKVWNSLVKALLFLIFFIQKRKVRWKQIYDNFFRQDWYWRGDYCFPYEHEGFWLNQRLNWCCWTFEKMDKIIKMEKIKKMVIKDQIDQNGENWKMVIKDKNCLNDQKWSKIVKLTIMVKNDENSQNYKYGQNGRKWSKNSIGVQSWMAAPSLVGKFSGQVWWLSGLVG